MIGFVNKKKGLEMTEIRVLGGDSTNVNVGKSNGIIAQVKLNVKMTMRMIMTMTMKMTKMMIIKMDISNSCADVKKNCSYRSNRRWDSRYRDLYVSFT